MARLSGQLSVVRGRSRLRQTAGTPVTEAVMADTNEWSGQELQKLQERLVSDSSLRDGLTDEQASQLLDWGLDQLRREVQRASALPPDEVRSHLETQVAAIRQVMRRANRMVDDLAGATQDTRREHLLRFLEGLHDTGEALQMEELTALERRVLDEEAPDNEAVFGHLMSVMRTAATEEEEE